jgi:tetratricopeptide (TPR) repeat protein
MDICRHLDCEPVAARPPSTAYRLSKFARKHRAGVAATAAVALALVAGLATASFGMARAMRARADEQRQRQAAERANDQAIAALRLLRDMSDDRAGGAEARARLAEPSDRLDAGWLRDQPDTHVTVRTVLGRTYLRLDALDEARHQFEAAVRVNREAHGRPGGVDTADAAWALRGIGWIVLQRGEYAAAEQYMLQALEAYRSSGEPGRSDVVDLLHALSYGRTLRDDVVAAGRFRVEALAEQEAVLSQRIAFQPDHAESYYARGEVRARRGRIREAQPDLVRARDPGNHRTLYLLSVVNIYLGDDGAYRQSAREMYDRFIESDVREVGERTAKTCLLTPVPVGDLAALSRALDRALAPSQDVSVVGWFRVS